MAEAETWLTVGQAAKRVGVSEMTIRRYIATGRLPALILPSGHRRILASALHRLGKLRLTSRP